jgi:hypothetical protein
MFRFREFLPPPCKHTCTTGWYVAMTSRAHSIIFVVLAKHEIAPWWWFLREPKHVGAMVGILIVLIFLWFYNCVHQFGKIKKCLDNPTLFRSLCRPYMHIMLFLEITALVTQVSAKWQHCLPGHSVSPTRVIRVRKMLPTKLCINLFVLVPDYVST